MTTSWPASAAAGSRQALSAVHSVVASTPGRATSTEQAPHSPSAHPSLAPVRPIERSQSSAFASGGAPASGRTDPFTVTSASVLITATVGLSTARPGATQRN